MVVVPLKHRFLLHGHWIWDVLGMAGYGTAQDDQPIHLQVETDQKVFDLFHRKWNELFHKLQVSNQWICFHI